MGCLHFLCGMAMKTEGPIEAVKQARHTQRYVEGVQHSQLSRGAALFVKVSMNFHQNLNHLNHVPSSVGLFLVSKAVPEQQWCREASGFSTHVQQIQNSRTQLKDFPQCHGMPPLAQPPQEKTTENQKQEKRGMQLRNLMNVQLMPTLNQPKKAVMGSLCAPIPCELGFGGLMCRGRLCQVGCKCRTLRLLLLGLPPLQLGLVLCADLREGAGRAHLYEATEVTLLLVCQQGACVHVGHHHWPPLQGSESGLLRPIGTFTPQTNTR